jgi:methyl-accepting chemotaxis protein
VSSSKRRRFSDVLRRTANLSISGARGPLEDASLWDARDKAAKASSASERLAEKVAASATRQRAQLETALERSNGFGARTDAAGSSARLAVEAFERLGIVALNAGLEGARLGEAQGKALSLLADEIKANVTNGIEAGRKLMGLTVGLGQDALELAQRLDRMNKESQELGGDAALLKAAAQDTSLALSELETRLRKATGLDPEIARNLADAGDHAKGLILALTALEARDIGEEKSAVTDALGPVLSPLKKLLAVLSEAEGDRSGGPRSDET